MTLPPISRQTCTLQLAHQEIPYQLIRSPRRTRLTLRVTSSGEVEVHVPWRVGQQQVEAFMREQGSWLLARRTVALAAMKQRPRLTDGVALPFLDSVLTLRVAGEEATRIRRMGDELWVPPPLTPGGLESMLERWYRGQARIYLTARLQARALEMGVSLTKTTIRGQKSRWGSCSSNGSINLNWQLMFRPSRVVEYVIVHELCHRYHMDHSPQFWAKVRAILPDYVRLRRELKTIQTPWDKERM
ncbi:MAG: M48 family metallopeptidase [Magnetococcus sp. YQC-5]